MAEKCKTIRRAATAVAILPQDKHRPPLFDIKALKKRIGSRWLDVHEALAPSLTDALRNPGEHVPCPVQGGDDGFRFFDDVEVTGGGICNTCGPRSDGIALLQLSPAS